MCWWPVIRYSNRKIPKRLLQSWSILCKPIEIYLSHATTQDRHNRLRKNCSGACKDLAAYGRNSYIEFGKEVQAEFLSISDNYMTSCTIQTVVSVILIILIPAMIWRPITHRIIARYSKLKQILKPFPPQLMGKMRGILSYLIKISPETLGTHKVKDFEFH